MTGLCSRLSCPLANSNYSTVLEKKGKLFLYQKTVERIFTPKDLWEVTQLSDNYETALKTIEEKLEFGNPFQAHKCKQRLTKLTQMLKRMRKLKLKAKQKLTVIKKKAERRDEIRMEKAEQVAKVDINIEKELVDRLQQGIHQGLYDDILNWNKTAFDKLLEKQNAVSDEEVLSEEISELENLEYVFDRENKEGDEEASGESGDEREEERDEIKKKKKIIKKTVQKKKKMELLMEEPDEKEEIILNH